MLFISQLKAIAAHIHHKTDVEPTDDGTLVHVSYEGSKIDIPVVNITDANWKAVEMEIRELVETHENAPDKTGAPLQHGEDGTISQAVKA